MPKRIVIIDDDETYRFLYQYHFRDVADIEIVGEFERAEDALQQIPHLKPDLVIVDYTLPGMSGIECAERLLKYPDIKVLIATGHDREKLVSDLKGPLKFEVLYKDWTEANIERIKALCK